MRVLETLLSDDEVEPEDVEDSDPSFSAFEFAFDDGSGVRSAVKKASNEPEAKRPAPAPSKDSVKPFGVSEDAAGRDRRKAKVGIARAQHEAADDAAIAAGVFEEVITEQGGALTFDELQLSRPLLRALAALGFSQPTPVQERCIPLALAGRDICASAATGSGKTAAFALPTLEKILQLRRGDSRAATRCVIILPTRELAAQCEQMIKQLSKFAPEITTVLIVGGEKDVKRQEARLRERPDIIVATPGRLVDHISNAHSVHLDDIEVCILDEADRLLELGFEDELAEVLKALPGGNERLVDQVGSGTGRRQTLLFSATLGARVESLAKLSLRRPIRIRLASSNGAGGVVQRLTQDFIKLKDGAESEAAEREASLIAILSKTLGGAGHRTVCFFDTRAACTHFFFLCEALRRADNPQLQLPSVCELHGGLRQAERLANLARFERGDVECLLCTDVAARGLDVTGVSAVVNAEMPRNVHTYVHRVGRTARAGRSGLAVTLVGASRRGTLKELVRSRQADMDASEDAAALSKMSGEMRSRVIAPAVLADMREAISAAARDVTQFERRRRDKIELDTTEYELTRAENVLKFADEIAARPKREWFQSTTDKAEAKKRAKEDAEAQELKAGERESKEFRENLLESKKKRATELAGDKTAKKPHRLTRAKRRRLEALEALHGEGGSEEEDDREPVKKKKKSPIENSKFDFEGARAKDDGLMKGYAKAAKRKVQHKEDDNDRIAGAEAPRKPKPNMKPKKDMKKGAAPTGEPKPAPSTRHFTEFNPDKVGKKKSLRSKTRHKR
ncbi:P-loop containing nucleoside triphosphate hydrolase protein [Pelagophyceae sp. CCMP2097]|nr:P-loop containing nucleoside triphosphate hydrolase protein [Pelagophyceae sp. CCMP2097]